MAKRSQIVFFGTPDFAVPTLETLADATDVVSVVTRPDQRTGRGKKVSPPPVKEKALELGLTILQPEIVKGKRFAKRIAEFKPDFIVTAAFGKLVGPSLLETPQKTCLNVHASILPKHRGAAPVNWTILKGDPTAGVSIMQMNLGLDTGPVYTVERTEVGPEETAGELLKRIARLGAKATLHTIENFADLSPIPQDDQYATWAPMLRKSDGAINWEKPADELHRLVRGLHPWPCATTKWNGGPLKIHAARIVNEDEAHPNPGTVVDVTERGIDMACGKGVLRLVEVQAAGRKRLPVHDFLKGAEVRRGQRL